MADRSEDEQLDVIKRWWKENGTSLIAGAALAAAGVFGWNAWQDYQADKAEAASVRYQQLVSLAVGNELVGDQLSEAREMVDEIVSEHDSTLYAELALLLDARLAVQQDDLDSAVASLTQVAESSSRRYVQSLAWLRLARLAIANEDPERALELLDEPITESLAAQQANVRGDAHMALGQHDQARNAWQDALELAQQQGQPLYGVQFKLDDLGAEETAQ
ncbi:Putative negative regulator of RcsB-dependent stress response [Vreelandella subterranea]|uniref:Ancillary SecYEG translocon subunit n=1 Tax=Vreelandella subterranea TaxID=416874 RepID=A0A1H9U2X7_9GAMM|nr:tetratricopeptide repeat protein [Halomonas subterranea]SES03719.1 Putative negative regulator of RcsB-dependent stress response [Halomonas subterranea]